MTDRWQRYFAQHGAFGREWLKAAALHWSFNEVLYGMLLKHCPPPARILDVGCGPGWSDLYLTSAGYDVTGVDNDQNLIELARSMATRMQLQTRFEVADAFDLRALHGRFDMAYSCGVLEHFERDQTVRLLAEQARCARLVLIQIPTRFSAQAIGITDERIYSMGQLRKIVRDAQLNIVASFGYGDVTASRSQIWLRRVLPRAIWRWMQNRGFAFSIAVIGERRNGR